MIPKSQSRTFISNLLRIECNCTVDKDRWISAVQARPSYKAAILDWETAKDEERNRMVSAKATPHFVSALNVI